MGTGMQPLAIVKLGKVLTKLLHVLQGEKHRSALVDKIAFGRYNSHIDHPKTGMDWLSTREQEVEKYLADPLCGFRFTVNGFATLFELIDRLYDPALLRKTGTGGCGCGWKSGKGSIFCCVRCCGVRGCGQGLSLGGWCGSGCKGLYGQWTTAA